MKKLIAIDLSMRCAGLVAFDGEGRLVSQLIVPTTKEEYDDEYMLKYMEEQVTRFYTSVGHLSSVVIEGLSHGSKSGRADLIAGNWWNIVKETRIRYPTVTIGSIPVTTWRSKVLDLSKAGKALLIEKYGDKLYLKQGVVDKVPGEVLSIFNEYLGTVEWPNKYPASKKREALFDLCDAYWLGRHRLNIGPI